MALVGAADAAQLVLQDFNFSIKRVHFFLQSLFVLVEIFIGIVLLHLLAEHALKLLDVLFIRLLGVLADGLVYQPMPQRLHLLWLRVTLVLGCLNVGDLLSRHRVIALLDEPALVRGFRPNRRLLRQQLVRGFYLYLDLPR